MVFSSIAEWDAMCVCAFVCSIVAAVIWPSVPLTVHEDVSSKKCGTAFGILTVFQNLSMAVFPVRDHMRRSCVHCVVSTRYI